MTFSNRQDAMLGQTVRFGQKRDCSNPTTRHCLAIPRRDLCESQDSCQWLSDHTNIHGIAVLRSFRKYILMKIDEAEIIASKILRHGVEIQKNFSTNFQDTAQLLTTLCGLVCVNQQRTWVIHRMPSSLFEAIDRFLNLPSSVLDDRARQFHDIIDHITHVLEGRAQFHLQLTPPVIEKASRVVTDLMMPAIVNGSLDPLAVFNIMYRRLLESEYEVEYRNGPRIAELMHSLFDSDMPVLEYFMCFGDVSLMRKSHAYPVAYGTFFPPHEFLLRLRLWLHNVELVHVPEDEQGSRAFSFFSHPQHHTSDAERASVLFNRTDSALSALYKRSDKGLGINPGIAVIPGRDRTVGGWRERFRRELTESGKLEAIIDIPVLGKSSKKNSLSIWVIGSGSIRAPTVLCIDASKLPKREFTADRDTLDSAEMLFISRIVEAWQRRFGPSRPMQHSPLEHAYSRLFDRYFSDGYQDVAGLCRDVPKDELAQRKHGLRASLYLKPTREREFFSSIDSSSILEKLDQHQNQSIRAYIIGNNGAGKSLLLSELVGALQDRNIRSIGIAFGAADRFPFHTKSQDNKRYIYRGARTSKKSISRDLATRQIAKLTRDIHINQSKLNLFIEAMGLLGFERRHYLVPLDFPLDEAHQTNERLAELILLTDDALVNGEILASARQRQYQLGLMRTSERGRVALFDTLSSGEQQVLTLIIKLVADAAADIVALIDEPEISLHVAWQKVLPSVFALIGERTGCSMVIATHSPVVVASASNQFDFRFVAKNEDLTPLPVKSSQSVDTVLFDDFATYTENNRRIHERCAAIVAEVIRELNANTDESGQHILNLRQELEAMKEIVKAPQAAVITRQRTSDLELIRRADLAVAEILEQRNLSDGIDEEKLDEEAE